MPLQSLRISSFAAAVVNSPEAHLEVVERVEGHYLYLQLQYFIRIIKKGIEGVTEAMSGNLISLFPTSIR